MVLCLSVFLCDGVLSFVAFMASQFVLTCSISSNVTHQSVVITALFGLLVHHT